MRTIFKRKIDVLEDGIIEKKKQDTE